MEFRKLGRSDIDVSLICLGTMTWGEQNTEADAHDQLDYALDHEVNFVDTAEIYAVPTKAETQGLTEQYIGTWFKARGNRDKVVLATKVAGRSGMSWLRENEEIFILLTSTTLSSSQLIKKKTFKISSVIILGISTAYLFSIRISGILILLQYLKLLQKLFLMIFHLLILIQYMLQNSLV